jgi:threonyl-tRNA synthetase
MFVTESEKRDYALKPMNCPGHILIFKQGIKSYRDLPLRYGEFGQCHRNEPSGGLHGIMRVRGFTQDDGHVFCTEDMILDECVAYTALLQQVYKDFGFSRSSTRWRRGPTRASAPTPSGTRPKMR